MTNPPGDDNAGKLHESAPEEHKHEEEHLKHATPDTNPWVCIILLVITVTIMAITAEFVCLTSLTLLIETQCLVSSLVARRKCGKCERSRTNSRRVR